MFSTYQLLTIKHQHINHEVYHQHTSHNKVDEHIINTSTMSFYVIPLLYQPQGNVRMSVTHHSRDIINIALNISTSILRTLP